MLIQIYVFERHQLLFPLLVALEIQLSQGEITEKEMELLGANLGDLEAQLELAGEAGASNLAAKPSWVADKVTLH